MIVKGELLKNNRVVPRESMPSFLGIGDALQDALMAMGHPKAVLDALDADKSITSWSIPSTAFRRPTLPMESQAATRPLVPTSSSTVTLSTASVRS
jgi:hypothetical protein